VKRLILALIILVSAVYLLVPFGNTFTPLDLSKLSSAQQSQLDLATASKAALGKELVSTLTAKMQADGPLAAIDLCNTEALPLTAKIAAQQGVLIGRTSFRLRNPQNASPQWAAATVAAESAEMQAFAGSDGSLSVLYPIMTEAKCLVCHTSKEKMAPPVLAELQAKYVADEAFGFSEGALRGYFWVEVAGQN
jgi:hypothetical protein